MGDNARARASSSGGKAQAAAAPPADQRTPVDAPASCASTEARTDFNESLQASEEAATADASDSAALQRPPRPDKARKPSATPPTSSAAKRRKNGGNTPLQTPPEVPAPEPERPLLSESQWEREIAGFGTVLNDVLHCVTNRDLVTKTAEYMATFPQHALRFQIKMKQRAYAEGARGFQAKLMLFYVLHEFLKSFEGERLQQVQREWFQTVDEVLNACAREIRYGDKRNSEENRKRVFKTLARWEELKLYPRKIKAWKGLVMGECKPRRAPVPLPRGETERQAEAPDQLQQFQLPPPSTPQLQLDRSNCPLVFERRNFDSKPEEKQHWRYTAIAFIDILSRCLGLSSDIALTACIFFHRVFDRGIYARERYKFAAACLFLSAKASSKRMKLLRMVRVMYDILEAPLFAGDEELLEIERLQLLYYEMEVLQGINFELTTEMPFYYLRRVLEKMPEKFRDAINDDAQTVLEELFFLPVCVDISPQLLGEAAAYIATWNKGKDFKFKWCSPSPEGKVFNERTASTDPYRSLQRWKKSQQAEFDALAKPSSSFEGDEAAKLKEAFKPQVGGLRLDPSGIRNEAEFTKKTEEDSKEWAKTAKTSGGGYRSNGQKSSRRDDRSSASTSSRRFRDDEPRIKQEIRRDVRYSSRDKYSSYDRDDRGYDKDDRGYDRRDSRDLDYRRDPSYFDRRERKSGGNGHRDRDSRSNSRSRSRSRSSRPSSRSSRKRKRNYSSRGRSDSRSRSSSRSHSRDRSQHYYRSEDPSPSTSSRSARTSKGSKYDSGRSGRRDAERPRVKQERSAA
ncbi:hypothetical protein PHYSODRAFT_253183 [Phytophthora sojae]|uniref:Cyclin N-terminal domain-containing protein n=1 Tax=Phytophthora sojae (strain P6497) TaxID=1094619 RepID=G4ZZH8_PHYSP|nr:hypothetical protein PHYSODRAFT_253183 [Phytophthora sojae]EGZ11178.1 hypothetical protein PHYSODRAFT_253183 [Phytophthora sojae]|eukprot:XP_009533923.1 hypothetical protein PHYSODRAFT_253183 [Phytophthora sojae]